jgi:hypothetical protein
MVAIYPGDGAAGAGWGWALGINSGVLVLRGAVSQKGERGRGEGLLVLFSLVYLVWSGLECTCCTVRYLFHYLPYPTNLNQPALESRTVSSKRGKDGM